MKKSKKALKLEATYNDKVEVMLFLYKNGFSTMEKTLKEARKLTDDFTTFLGSALHFDMISMKDFEALWHDNVVEGKYNYSNYRNVNFIK